MGKIPKPNDDCDIGCSVRFAQGLLGHEYPWVEARVAMRQKEQGMNSSILLLCRGEGRGSTRKGGELLYIIQQTRKHLSIYIS